MADVSLAEAIEMASTRPASLIGLQHLGLEVGASANLVLFRLPSGAGPLEIVSTLHAGETA
jgi:dihydroorotase-like cyclic amidohydrolase